MKDHLFLAAGTILAVYGSTEEFVDKIRDLLVSLF